MKARLVKTSFWSDEKIESLTINAKYLFLYLITNSYIGLTGAIKVSDNRIMFETGLDSNTLSIGYQELQEKEFIQKTDGWIVVKNTEKHNNYSKGIKTGTAFLKEFESLPNSIKEAIGYTYPMDTLGIDTETINKKTETVKQNTETVDTDKFRTKLREKGFRL